MSIQQVGLRRARLYAGVIVAVHTLAAHAAVPREAPRQISDAAHTKNAPAVIHERIVPDAPTVSMISSVREQKLHALATHPQWQHLLFYKHHKAEVISDNFYLTQPKAQPTKSLNPYDELVATLQAANDKAILCHYPARYLWLSHQLPDFQVDLAACLDLPNANQQVSLMLVSSYLKNPASSFGHVLVKTRDAKAPSSDSHQAAVQGGLSSEDLLNDTYNFGARIPSNENGVMYALKGLFGFYDAGFSKTEFFKQDAVYSKNEQRDMWEYVLNLDPFHTQLLNYHLYEAQQARFDYYFIKQNCGYRSGEILELVSDIKTTERLGAWYAPDYVFDQLVEYQSTDEPLIAAVRYLPSEQTQLRATFVQLPKKVQTAINAFIDSEDISTLAALSEKEQALATDFLILHRNYKISQDDTPEHRAVKKALLSQRFLLPADNTLATLPVPDKPSPALSNKTTQTKVSISSDTAKLGVSLFVKDPLNTYTDIDKRFEAIQLTLGYDYDANDVAVTDFVFLDMQQIEDVAQPLHGEPKLSWQLKTGAREDVFTGAHHSPYATAGIGAGIKFDDDMLGYGMLNTAVHDQESHADVGLELGLRVKAHDRAAELSYQLTKRASYPAAQLTTLTLRQQLSKNNDARLIVTHGEDTYDSDGVSASAAWHHYW